jgi:hypothetical protein
LKARLFLVLALALLCSSALALPLQPYEISYQTKARGFTINTVRKLENTGTVFELSQIAGTMMMQTSEKSIFSVNSKGIFTPHSFTYQRKILGNNKFQNTDFKPKKKIATYQQKGEAAVQVAIPDSIYDIFSYQEKLRLNLINSKGKTGELSFKVLERNRIRDYQFRIIGSEWIKTSQGYMDTLKIERVRENSAKKTITWLAKDWGYVVVKVQHKEEGEPEYHLNMVQGALDKKNITGSKDLPAPAKTVKTAITN